MKKALALILAVLMTASLAACGGKSETTAAPAETKATEAQQESKKETAPATQSAETQPAETTAADAPEEHIRPEDPDTAFVDLVAQYGGFEIAYSQTEDRYVICGGKDNIFWQIESRDNEAEIYFRYAVLENGSWTDYYFETRDGGTEPVSASAGDCIGRISWFAYFAQEEIDADPRTPQAVTDAGVDCDRYSYNFGAKAYDIAREYGVTARFSDTDNNYDSFELEYIRTGSEVEIPEQPEGSRPEGDIDDPSYWDSYFGVSICPFYVNIDGTENTYYFRGGGSFAQWLNTEMNTEGWYYHNGRIITKDGKWAVPEDYDDVFSSCCEYIMEPYDGPTLSEEEQAEVKKGVVYTAHSWTPLHFGSWYGMFLEGDEVPAEEKEFTLTELRTDFCEQEWISVYKAERLSAEDEEGFLVGHAKLYVFPHRDLAEYRGVITEADESAAMTVTDYLLREDPEGYGDADPVFRFYIPNEYQGAAFAGDADLIFTYDNVIAYCVTVTAHEAGWTP